MSLGRILIVDDDRTLASMIEEELGRAGFDCVRCASDHAAQRALDGGRAFDGLVTDINLGEGVTGFDLARSARARHPHIRIVYMSGEANAHHWLSFGVPGSDYLSKPFALEKLRALFLQGLAPETRRPAGSRTSSVD